MNLKEVFVSLKLDSKAAEKSLEHIDDLTDEVTDGFKDVGTSGDKATKQVETGAKKAATSMERLAAEHKRVVDAFDKVKPFAEWGRSIVGGITAGTAALAGFAGLAGKFVADWAHGANEIDRTARQFGLSTDALQELQFAAKATGGEAESIGEVFKEMAIRITEVAQTGSGPATDALNALGLSAKELAKLKPEQQMMILADAVAGVADAGQRFFLKDSLFGEEGGVKVGNLLEEGAAGIAKLRGEAQALGGVLTGDSIKAAKEFNKELAKTGQVVTGVKSTIAQALLPVVSDAVKRFSEWVQANRELIKTKAEEWAKRLAEWFEKLVPMIGSVVDAVGKLVDAVGGIEPAIKLAATGWAAWQLAGLAAIGTVGAALATFMASFAAGMALADRFAGGPEERAKNKRTAAELAKFKSSTDLLEANAADSGDPAVERAKRRLLAELETLRGAQAGGGDRRGVNRQRAIDEQFGAVARADAALRAAIAESDAALTMTPDGAPTRLRSSTPGAGKAALTADSLLREQRKTEAEREKLRSIRTELEGRRMNASGSERMAIERTLADVNQRLTGGEVRGVQQLMAEAVGQNTGYAGAELRPAGLGTSINQIDASIHINVGGVDVELPASIIDPANPRASAQGIGDQIATALSQVFGQAARLQVAQING